MCPSQGDKEGGVGGRGDDGGVGVGGDIGGGVMTRVEQWGCVTAGEVCDGRGVMAGVCVCVGWEVCVCVMVDGCV